MMPGRTQHPTPHPRSGTYAARVAVPPHLRAIVARHHGPRVEFRENLRTKDWPEAVRRARPIFERFDGYLRAAEAEFRGGVDRLSDHDISALCGRWLAAREAESRHDMALTFDQHEATAEHLGDLLRALEGDEAATGRLADMDPEVGPLLAATGRAVDQDSRERLGRRLARVAWDWHRGEMERATSGRARHATTSADFPAAPLGPATAPGCTTDQLLASWAGDRGYRLDAKPIARPLYERLRTIRRLADFLQHDDAARVTKADAVRWKAEMQGRNLTAASVRNDLSEMSALWRHGIANGLVGDNPFAGISPPKAKRRAREVRPFTREEAATVLEAARRETGALRWLPWVCAMTGARLGEICQSAKEDVAALQGVPVLRIHDEGDEGRSLKNEDSRRTVPLHPALVAEGFLAYVAALPAGSPLFPDVRPDKVFGRRSETAGRMVARWLRGSCGITDPRISPSHSWRHYFIDRCREVAMPLEVRSALTGHSGRADESAGYGDGMRAFVVVMAEHLGRVVLR